MYAPTWITIEAGDFTMGSDARDAAPPFVNERPRHRFGLTEFRISRVPITQAQYLQFVIATGHPAPGHWRGGQPAADTDEHPVTYVTWNDAQAFCAWAGVRLPSEAEWEKAARSDDGRWWPWGDTLPDASRAHFKGQAQGVAPAAQSVMPVGSFPNGASEYGALDMAGNVWEWTHSLFRPYPYRADDGREDPATNGLRVVRGGSYNHDLRQIRCAARDGMAAGVRDVYIGFRVAATENAPTLTFDWVHVPTGDFWMGSDAASRTSAALPSEMPQQRIAMPAFQLAQTPVTNAEYAEFVRATAHAPPAHWFAGVPPENLHRHPVTHVDWHAAQAFCTWAGARLPTEAEWEKAARGGSTAGERARVYPWGDAPPDATRLNFRRVGNRAATTPVDHFPFGVSASGALDMAGNVWEWVSSAYAPYPYRADDGREDLTAHVQRVLRGGSFASPSARFVRCAMRSLSWPERRREHIGFRVAHD